jgi:hypothetical protein
MKQSILAILNGALSGWMTGFLVTLVIVCACLLAWARWPRKAPGPYRFTPPDERGETATLEQQRYMGEVLPRQREMVLACYRFLTNEEAPDTRPLGFQELTPGGIMGLTGSQLGPILPLSPSLCVGCQRLGYKQLFDSVYEELKKVVPEQYHSTMVDRILVDLPAEHAVAVAVIKNVEAFKARYRSMVESAVRPDMLDFTVDAAARAYAEGIEQRYALGQSYSDKPELPIYKR